MNPYCPDDGQVNPAVVRYVDETLVPDASVAYHQHHIHASGNENGGQKISIEHSIIVRLIMNGGHGD